MRWASAVSLSPRTEEAVAEVLAAVARDLDGAGADLAVLFVSPYYAADPALPARVAAALGGARLIGCSARGVIGAGHEVEEQPALSLTVASLPGVTLAVHHLPADALLDDPSWLAGAIGAAAAPQLVVLADPFSCDAEALIGGLDAAFPDGHTVGGLASGGRLAGDGALYADGHVHRSGAVCLAMTGDLTVETIVAQGCRPIGRPLVATRVDGNVVYELDGKPPGALLRTLYESLPVGDQALFRHSLFVGLDMNSSAVSFGGELLARNLAGMDPSSGAMAVGAQVRPWQVVQFLLRDATTARADLTGLLERYHARGGQPAGALLFSCLGRGRHLFGAADHDTGLFHQHVGPVPLGGFFCNGEIGPVGGATFLHGYTSAFGLFRPRSGS